MAFLSVAISVAFLIYLILRILRMLGGTTATVQTRMQAIQAGPDITDKAILSQLDRMPTEWVTYAGAGLTFRLKIRGLSEVLRSKISQTYLMSVGSDNIHPSAMQEFVMTHLPEVTARCYVTDWEGAKNADRSTIRYTPDNLAYFLRKDEAMLEFVLSEAARVRLRVIE
ncbi:MAG: hypothetical protein JSR34_12615 [Proteobacteria bacterium]|nr:hypothetical protein [Pseudomonadota bacterium]